MGGQDPKLFACLESQESLFKQEIYLVLFASRKVLLLHLHHACSPSLLNSVPAYRSSCL